MRDLIERLDKVTRDLVNEWGTDSYRIRCELYDITKELQSIEERWVDVLDRCPVEGERVLCYGLGDRMFTAIYVFGEFVDNDGDGAERVTHWTSLPPHPNKPKQP